MRYFRWILTALALLSACKFAVASDITIYRDKWGVPSVVADELVDVAYGLGYVSAQDNAVRMALNYKTARGRLAEVQGKAGLLTDGVFRSLGFEEMAESAAAKMPEPAKSFVESYCAGANKSLTEQKGKIPDWIHPFASADVIALGILINAAFPLNAIRSQLLPGSGFGSNQFAVAPSRTATHHAIISQDPHLPWADFLLWYEFAFYSKDVHFRGMSLIGLPFGNMGHTDRIAWCMTNNDPVLSALYAVRINPKNPKEYDFHGEWKPFGYKTIELNYLEDGEMKTQKQVVRMTEWGPMAPIGQQAIKISLPNPDNPDQVMRMIKAKNIAEFRKALKTRQLSMWNFVFADVEGHIGFQYNACLPRRDPLFDWRHSVPGDDPRTKWGTLFDLDELPHIMNPKSGVLVNCNSAPYLTPLDNEMKTDWPAYVTSDGHTTRYDRLSAIVRADRKITVQKAMKYATDTEVPDAKAAVQALLHAGANAPDAKPALDVLRAWNARADIDAKGCGLYVYWLLDNRRNPQLAHKVALRGGWTLGEANEAISSLMSAADKMRADHGKLDPAWGEMHAARRGQLTVPVLGSGVLPGEDDVCVAPNSGPFSNGNIRVNVGSSWRMIVSLDPKGVQSWSGLPFGESQDPANPHYADQMAMFGRGDYKPTHFGLAGAKKTAVSTTVLKR